MRFVLARSIFAVLIMVAPALLLISESAEAQSMGGSPGGGRKQHQQQQKADKTDVQKPKADDKAYNAVLKSLPDKPFDPWNRAR